VCQPHQLTAGPALGAIDDEEAARPGDDHETVDEISGTPDLSGYNKEERADIARGVKQVKERSTAVFSRLSHIFKNFDPSGSETFTDFFQTQVDNFKERTKDWDLDKVLGMTER